MPNYYPVMLDIRNRPVLVLGGDAISAEKATALAASGASFTVQHATFGPEIQSLAEHGAVALRQKVYEPGDLAGAFIVVLAATSDPALIEAVWLEAQRNNQPLNVVDVPHYCTFILPSVLRRGKLTITVSTEGSSPSLAKRVRQQLEANFPPAYAAYIDLAAQARVHLRQQGISYDTRDDFFRAFMAAPVLDALNAGEHVRALELTAELLRSYGVEVQISDLTPAFIEEHTDAPAQL